MIRIYDDSGRDRWNMTLDQGVNSTFKISPDLSPSIKKLENGFYFLSISSGNSVSTKSLIKLN